jgi:hypothetical protein
MVPASKNSVKRSKKAKKKSPPTGFEPVRVSPADQLNRTEDLIQVCLLNHSDTAAKTPKWNF